MNRLQLRYKTEEQIIRAIDRTAANKLKWAARAEAFNSSADALYAQSAKEMDLVVRATLVKDAEEYREEARRIRGYQQRYTQKLNRLGKTLAAFRTMAMPFVEESVVLQ